MYVLPNPDYESHPDFRESLAQVDDALRCEALAKFLPNFEACYQRHLTAPKVNYDAPLEGPGGALLSRLQEAGCALHRIPPQRKAELAALTLPVAERLHARMQLRGDLKFRDTQFVFNRQKHADIFAAVERIFEEEHVHAAASAYASRPVFLKEVTVQVNTDVMTRRDHGPLGADGLPAVRTRYMHIDSGHWPPVKALIYLSEVTPDRGPFIYAEGSHRLATDFELMVRKTNDLQSMRDSLFMALPPPFRMYTRFGDFIDPESEAAKRLMARERAYHSEDGDLILFDYNGVHRGGFVREGYRYMLQCHLERKTKVQRQISAILGVENEGAG